MRTTIRKARVVYLEAEVTETPPGEEEARRIAEKALRDAGVVTVTMHCTQLWRIGGKILLLLYELEK